MRAAICPGDAGRLARYRQGGAMIDATSRGARRLLCFSLVLGTAHCSVVMVELPDPIDEGPIQSSSGGAGDAGRGGLGSAGTRGGTGGKGGAAGANTSGGASGESEDPGGVGAGGELVEQGGHSGHVTNGGDASKGGRA